MKGTATLPRIPRRGQGHTGAQVRATATLSLARGAQVGSTATATPGHRRAGQGHSHRSHFPKMRVSFSTTLRMWSRKAAAVFTFKKARGKV